MHCSTITNSTTYTAGTSRIMILSVISCIDASYTPFIYFIIIIELQGSALSPLSTLVELNTTLLLFLISLEFDESKSHRKFLQQGCIISFVVILPPVTNKTTISSVLCLLYLFITYLLLLLFLFTPLYQNWRKNALTTNKRILPSIECKGEIATMTQADGAKIGYRMGCIVNTQLFRGVISIQMY